MTAPWTQRERALYEALELARPMMNRIDHNVGAYDKEIAAEELVDALLADPPPPDPRDAALRLAEEAIEECKTYITLYQTDSDGPQACEAPIIHNDYLKCEKALASIRAANGGA